MLNCAEILLQALQYPEDLSKVRQTFDYLGDVETPLCSRRHIGEISGHKLWCGKPNLIESVDDVSDIVQMFVGLFPLFYLLSFYAFA